MFLPLDDRPGEVDRDDASDEEELLEDELLDELLVLLLLVLGERSFRFLLERFRLLWGLLERLLRFFRSALL